MNDNITPGPWTKKYNEQSGVEEVWSAEGLVAEVRWTRSLPDVPGTRVNEEANAVLIAAAPTLYEYLREAAIEFCQRCRNLEESSEGSDRCTIRPGACYVQKWRELLDTLKKINNGLQPLKKQD